MAACAYRMRVLDEGFVGRVVIDAGEFLSDPILGWVEDDGTLSVRDHGPQKDPDVWSRYAGGGRLPQEYLPSQGPASTQRVEHRPLQLVVAHGAPLREEPRRVRTDRDPQRRVVAPDETGEGSAACPDARRASLGGTGRLAGSTHHCAVVATLVVNEPPVFGAMGDGVV
jgi:hypothetical protein